MEPKNKSEERETRKNLHLGSSVLEPKLDLARLKTKLSAQTHSLLLVRMRAFPESPENSRKFR